MLQRGGRPDLGQEALGAKHCCEVGAHHLDRDVAAMTLVAREIHCRHAAASELAHDVVAAGERDAALANRSSA
ncbi:MAG: hypothetical protein ABI625_10045 [bacterium]